MSYYAEPYTSRKRRSKKTFFLVLLGLVVTLGVPGALYGPRLYYIYSGDPILRLEKRSRQFENDLRAGQRGPDELYEYLVDSRRVLTYLERDNPARAEIQYYRGLFQFYELLIRLPFTGDSALRLIGRLYLPEESPDSPLSARPGLDPIPELGKKTALAMRRALALDPGLPQARPARLAIALGDFLFTARTDPILLEYLDGDAEIREFFRPYHAWMSLVLFGMRGQVQEMETFLAAEEGSTDRKVLQMTSAHLDLARSFASFYGKQYIKSLQRARGVKSSPEATPFLRSEAARMEGEIFLVQRGPFAARAYFQEALKLSESQDEFLKNRLQEIAP